LRQWDFCCLDRSDSCALDQAYLASAWVETGVVWVDEMLVGGGVLCWKDAVPSWRGLRSGETTALLRRSFPLRPDPLQCFAECVLAQWSCQFTLSQCAADPPELKTRKCQGDKTQLDISPVHLSFSLRIRADTFPSGSTPSKVGGNHTRTTSNSEQVAKNRHSASICFHSVSSTPLTITSRRTDTIAISTETPIDTRCSCRYIINSLKSSTNIRIKRISAVIS